MDKEIIVDKKLKALQRKLERMELEHLRQHAFELHQRVEELEAATESAEFWQRHAMDLQETLHDGEFATHRSIGINKSGELMVVKHDA